MSILKPVTQQDILAKLNLQEMAQRAKLNLNEVVALNKKFGTSLEYVPSSDVVEFATYYGKKIPATDELFHRECADIALDMALKLNKAIENKFVINNSVKSSLQASINSAIKKLKSVIS